MEAVYERDLDNASMDGRVPWELLDGRTFVITGATGLIGSLIVNVLLRRRCGIRLILPVRNIAKAKSMFEESGDLKFVPWDACSGMIEGVESCDYIIHCASNTDSRIMVEQPVDTIETTLNGTTSMLKLARRTKARLVFASSMEVYGSGSHGILSETDGGSLDAMSVRSSYPQAKQLAETLCAAYVSQYKTKCCVARLAQTFGAGVPEGDRRVFAEFARCCLEGRDIQLLTTGSKSNMYLYSTDAVSALLLLAAKGEPGEAYNVANPKTFCSILEMANELAATFGKGAVEVSVMLDDEAAKRYAPAGRLWMDTTKIEALGWSPSVGLMEAFRRMIDNWRGETI